MDKWIHFFQRILILMWTKQQDWSSNLLTSRPQFSAFATMLLIVAMYQKEVY